MKINILIIIILSSLNIEISNMLIIFLLTNHMLISRPQICMEGLQMVHTVNIVKSNK